MAKIKHIALATQEPSETAKFYREVFGLKVVGKVDNDNSEGYYLSDGSINIAVLRYKNETVAGEEFGTGYAGLHHIGFQVEDLPATDERLRRSNCRRRAEIDAAQSSTMGTGHGGRNASSKYTGPDGVMIDISTAGWVGTDDG
jgi:catechol 2,3-dioxygenase-like lactoylglutathione lyase family enzyme